MTADNGLGQAADRAKAGLIRFVRRRRATLAIQRPSDAVPLKTFHPRPRMVGWFDPRLLLQTAFVTGLGMVFGAYADKRDTFPLRDQLRPCDDAPFPDHTTEKEEGTWLDFVADIGDGFGPTYAVARALATPSLTVAGLSEPLPRGELLVMGGDEVYPAASKSRYENQAIGPYTLAAESADPDTATQEGGNPVELVALPGNHDWYDGLTTFLHAFAPGNRFGVWRTYAKRSYWARALPEGWSIFGVDAQLGGWIDSAQLQYFVDLVTEIDEAMAEQAADDPSTSPQAKVIVCWSTPVWLDAQYEPAGLENLDAFQDALGLASRRVAIEVVLTGDLHHYARFEDRRGRPWITAGGGGAFLFPTHHLPKVVPDRSHAELGPAGPQWRLRECYPSIGDSQKLGARLPLAFLFVNPSFVLLGGAVAFALSWGVQVGLMKSRINFAGVMRTVSLLGVRDGFSSSPIAILIGLGVVGAMTMFAKKAKAAWSGHGNIFRNALVARVVGALHGVAQVVGALAVCAGVAYVLRPVGRDGVFNVLFTLLVAIAGGVAAGAIMGVYLYLANLVGMHDNEAFSALHLSGYKNFLRMHIGRGGQLTIYALKIEGVPPPRRWFDRVAGAANRHGEQLVTVSDELGHCPVELIEKVDVVSVEVEQLSSSGQA